MWNLTCFPLCIWCSWVACLCVCVCASSCLHAWVFLYSYICACEYLRCVLNAVCGKLKSASLCIPWLSLTSECIRDIFYSTPINTLLKSLSRYGVTHYAAVYSPSPPLSLCHCRTHTHTHTVLQLWQLQADCQPNVTLFLPIILTTICALRQNPHSPWKLAVAGEKTRSSCASVKRRRNEVMFRIYESLHSE